MASLLKKPFEVPNDGYDNTQQLETLIDLAIILGQQNDFKAALQLVTRQATSLLGAEISLIMMINPQTHQTLKTIYVEGENKEQEDFHFIHTNLSGWVIKNDRLFISKNLSNDPRFRKSLFSNTTLKSAICVPFKAEGITIGTLLLMNKKRKAKFTKEHLNFLEKFAAIASPFLRNTQKIQEYFAPSLPQESLLTKYKMFGLLGKSPKFIELLNTIESAVKTDVRILLEGQSGTGKELIAKAIHQLSSRNENKFIAIDCGAMPANLMESELFGHVRGAFTGASSDRKGLLEDADGGTIFMDEISNLPLELQAKMLRVLQEGEIRPVGSNKTGTVDVRIICASSTSLQKLVETKLFREDLFYRLYVFPIVVPSLNERSEDIPLLASHFLKKFAASQQKEAELFHGEMLEFMKQKSWNGNIRELENFVERLTALANPEQKVLDKKILPQEFKKEFNKFNPSTNQPIRQKSLQSSLEEYEEQLIRHALKTNSWNQSKTARELKVSEQTIRYKMAKYEIKRPT